MYYNLQTLEFINMELPKNFDFTKTDRSFFSNEEFNFQKLWKDYFDSTTIKERKNLELHIRHVCTKTLLEIPKRKTTKFKITPPSFYLFLLPKT
jgi:hypothetical protein